MDKPERVCARGRREMMNRFWKKVEIRHGSDCWHWAGSINNRGYGQFWHDGRLVYAHRFAYEVFLDRIVPGLQFDHLCRNRACVNPWHGEIVSSRENTLRGRSPKVVGFLAGVCIRGHDTALPGGVYLSPGGRRQCAVCALWRSRRRYDPSVLVPMVSA